MEEINWEIITYLALNQSQSSNLFQGSLQERK